MLPVEFLRHLAPNKERRVAAQALIAQYGERAITRLAAKGRLDPAALSPDEVQAVAALAWLREMQKRT